MFEFLFSRRSQAPYENLKPELARYEWLEKELLHTVKSEIQQKMKKQSNKVFDRSIDSHFSLSVSRVDDRTKGLSILATTTVTTNRHQSTAKRTFTMAEYSDGWHFFSRFLSFFSL